MRKILSILIALGLIVGLSVMAVPTGAATCKATVTLTPATACAGAETTYFISFTAPVTLQPGDLLSVDFGAGTVLTGTAPKGVQAADVEVNGFPVTTIAVSGTHIDVTIPVAAGTIFATSTVTLEIEDVKNPTVAGDYSLDLDYKESCCDPVVFDCADYTINPLRSTYDFYWDSSLTYPGIALDFVPPFKACGQEDFTTYGGFNIGTGLTAKWLNAFTILLKPTLVGCAGPCAQNVTVTLNLTAAPTGANVTLSLNDTTWPSATIIDLTPTAAVAQPEIVIFDGALGANVTMNWSNAIHFDTVGSYQICLEAICPGGELVCPECTSEDTVIAYKCYDIEVYQWKTALKIPLYRKWNLISLPLVPLEADIPIEDVLAAHPNKSLIEAIYNYDCDTGGWDVWGNGQTSLATLKDGDAYWVKVSYVLGSATKGPGVPIGGLWVWGNPKPVPPASPSAYPVCAGWNMVGLTGHALAADPFNFTSLVGTTDTAYLHNWQNPAIGYGAIYAWDGMAQLWDGITIGGGAMPENQTGEGYWINFHSAGFVYPP